MRSTGPGGARNPQTSPAQPRAPAEISQLAALMNAGRHAEAEQQSRILIDRRPDLGFAWKVHGAALLLQNKDALQALRRANDLLPDDKPYSIKCAAHSWMNANLWVLDFTRDQRYRC